MSPRSTTSASTRAHVSSSTCSICCSAISRSLRRSWGKGGEVGDIPDGPCHRPATHPQFLRESLPHIVHQRAERALQLLPNLLLAVHHCAQRSDFARQVITLPAEPLAVQRGGDATADPSPPSSRTHFARCARRSRSAASHCYRSSACRLPPPLSGPVAQPSRARLADALWPPARVLRTTRPVARSKRGSGQSARERNKTSPDLFRAADRS